MFTAFDLQSEIQSAIVQETAQAYLDGQKRKTFFDYLAERAYGRELSDEELAGMQEQIALLLRKTE